MKQFSSFEAFLSRVAGLSGSMKATKVLRRRRWALSILVALILGAIGWRVYESVEAAMHDRMAAELTTIRDADVEALRVWMRNQEEKAQVLAQSEVVRAAARDLAMLADAVDSPELVLQRTKPLALLRSFLLPRLELFGYGDFLRVSPSNRVAAANDVVAIGKPLGSNQREFFQNVLRGRPRVSLPFRSVLLLPDEKGELKTGLPTMLTAAPVRDEGGNPVAVLALRIRPEAEFTAILQVARSGKSGETFVFDQNGLLLSQSRFDDDLKRVGLLADLPDSRSILTLELRDPQVNMVAGERPSLHRADQPLTRLVASAVSGKSGVNVSGFRDYRGVPSIGAWVWLPEYGFGVASKVDVAEAYRPLYILRFTFWGLFGLLALCAIAILIFLVMLERQGNAMRRAVLASKQLGQYTLEDRIGSGGMGTVYRARHALLRRPTAVKLLDIDKVSDAAIARFEREVQLSSQLNHPNTVAIYDYGKTPEGVFFYAMEYLDGINLEDLVKRFGPLPEGRVVSILRQVCGSLAEAHGIGLIHRDIKPANILLNQRGGLPDFVKVLDFGLVKALGGEREAHLTASGSLTGTPMYLSPEAIERPDTMDARADIYAIGAVGYFLLTGSPVFRGQTVVEICMKHVREAPEPPSLRLGRQVSAKLEAVVMSCLSKDPAGRPARATELRQELDRCDMTDAWSQEKAEAWWDQMKNEIVSETTASAASSSEVSDTVAYTPAATEKTHE